jgi:leucyl aminopeptidase
MRITFSSPADRKTGSLALFVGEGGSLSGAAARLDETTGGVLRRAIDSSRFAGKKGEILEVLAPAGVSNARLVMIGIGKAEDLTPRNLEAAGGGLVAHLNGQGESVATLYVEGLEEAPQSLSVLAAHAAVGALLRSYRFDKYKTREKPEKKPSLAKLTVMVAGVAAAKKAFAELEAVAGGVFTTRAVVSEPSNVIYPASFVAEAKKLGELGVTVSALGEEEMRNLGMGALLGVGQGSARESQLLIMQWNGSRRKKAPPLAFVGKGVCFDTGGISLKPAAGMEDMKWDMGGAGVVLGLMQALAARKAKVNVVGICGLVENMPGGNAQRPGDIVTSMSGQTIEVLNTDAEGRLVLADALWYTQQNFKPQLVVDLATLTGAIMIALGRTQAGLFSNDDTLAEQLTAAGKSVGEPLWRMPLGEDYDRMIDSEAADMKNIGNRWGGSITAAQFLQRFIEEGTPWAHLDIAGVTWSDKDKPTVPKGATAFGVRLLDHLVAEHYES